MMMMAKMAFVFGKQSLCSVATDPMHKYVGKEGRKEGIKNDRGGNRGGISFIYCKSCLCRSF